VVGERVCRKRKASSTQTPQLMRLGPAGGEWKGENRKTPIKLAAYFWKSFFMLFPRDGALSVLVI